MKADEIRLKTICLFSRVRSGMMEAFLELQKRGRVMRRKRSNKKSQLIIQ